jgi:hypothetical protein
MFGGKFLFHLAAEEMRQTPLERESFTVRAERWAFHSPRVLYWLSVRAVFNICRRASNRKIELCCTHEVTVFKYRPTQHPTQFSLFDILHTDQVIIVRKQTDYMDYRVQYH